MAIRTGIQRAHIVMLAITGLIAAGGIVAALTTGAHDDWWVYAGFGLVPLVLYLVIAWVAAGFLQKSDNAEVIHSGGRLVPNESVNIPVLASRWPRFWARNIDMWLETAGMGWLIALVMPTVASAWLFSGPMGDKLFGIAVIPFAMVLDAAIVTTFGNSLGKMIAGIRVAGLRGDKPSFLTLARRNVGVWWWGIGAGVPLVNLVAMWRSSTSLENLETLKWDELNNTRCYSQSNTGLRTSVAALAFFAVVCAVAGFAAYQSSPEAIARESVREINQQSPQIIDEETRLDGAEVGPSGEVIYLYTLTNISAETHDLDVVGNSIDSAASDSIIRETCAESATRPAIDAGVTLVYKYLDSDGMEVTSIRVNSYACGQAVR